MEMVAELVASRRNSLPWECIIRGGLVLAITGGLCIGSRSDAKDKPAKTAGDIVNPGTGEHILGPNARECGLNAKDTAVKPGEETGILAYIWEEDILNALVIPNGTAADIAGWPVIIEFKPETSVETVPHIEEPPSEEPPYIAENGQAAEPLPAEEEFEMRELAGCAGEIYIPANIREIEPGALDVFESLAYIEAAEDNPGYYSENGILYPKE